MKIAISAGELSGDEHIAHVLSAMRRSNPNIEVRGMAGRTAAKQGCELIIDIEKSEAVMGFATVLLALPRLLRTLSEMKRFLASWQPDLLMLVDFPDFNLRLAKYAKSLGIKVLYYIPPSVWAWRSGRVKLLERYTDCIAHIYPFEKKFYAERHVAKAHYVGHPLAEELNAFNFSIKERENWLRSNEFDPHQPLLAIFPGSRGREIRAHLALVAETLKLLRSTQPNLQFAISIAHGIDPQPLSASFDPALNVKFLQGQAINLLRFATVGLLKSGTSNLQAAFCGLPFVMFFKTSLSSEWIVRVMVKTREFSIVNLIRSRTVVELLQGNANPQAAAAEIGKLLSDEDYRSKVKLGLKEVVASLTSADNTLKASERVAQLALGLLSE